MANLDSPQWKRAKQTSLWKRTLGSDDEDVKPLRDSFLDARKNAAFLLDKIRPDFPNLTIHDITHVDSLWTVADAIIGENYPINPLEGYVLGIAFLIHDAALSYYAVGGKKELRKTTVWQDAYADGPGKKRKKEFQKECDFTAIRFLHAENAKKMLSESFKDNNGITVNIHGTDVYINHYGHLIGKIAASHHWSIDDVESKLKKQVNPMSGMPNDWKINAQKLACILRCADAGHIDDGRAPDAIYQSLIVNGVSRYHWEYQNHLCQVCEDENDKTKLCITSSNPFKKEEEFAVAAWHVAYDAVRIFDEELKKSNNLLIANHIKEFPHNGVSGANSKEDLAKYIETEGWLPCNFGVHTRNIKNLIETLGGSKLYGEDNMILVVLRELIQNARDAIHARQKMDDSFRDGRITIRLLEDGKNRFVEVEDNGIGMSMDCIKHHLLDFGSSYWKSSLSKEENPGLTSKKFESIGKFGIGFYSVFMVAKSVEVRTKRYDKGNQEAKRVEFPAGLTLSPIISNDSKSAGTIVRFELKDDVKVRSSKGPYDQYLYLKETLPILAAALDADIYYEKQCEPQRIHTNVISPEFDKAKWLADLCFPCPVNIDEIASKMEPLIDENGKQRGLLLPPEYKDTIKYQKESYNERIPSIETIGGLWSSLKYNEKSFNGVFIGYLDGREDRVSRDKMILDEPLKKCLQTWTREKYRKNYHEMIYNNHIAWLYENLIYYCDLENTIIDDNIRYLYAQTPLGIDDGSMQSLKKIYHYIHVAIRGISLSERFRMHFNMLGDESSINELFDVPRPDEELDKLLCEKIDFDSYFELGYIDPIDPYKRKETLMRLIKTTFLPISNYEEIIQKYCEFVSIGLFYTVKDTTLGVWVNLLLNKVLGQMIDWRQVKKKHLERLVYYRPNEVSGYLKQFLSSTYLDEMINNR